MAVLILGVRTLAGDWWSEASTIKKSVTRLALLVGIAVGGAASAEASDALDVDRAGAIAFGGPSSIVGQLDADQAPKASLLDVDRAMRPFREST